MSGVQHIGFVIFFTSFLFVYLASKLGIASHQQERHRPDFKKRQQQRSALLFVLICLFEMLIVPVLNKHPYMFLFF